MRISDWSSDVCSSDLLRAALVARRAADPLFDGGRRQYRHLSHLGRRRNAGSPDQRAWDRRRRQLLARRPEDRVRKRRSEERRVGKEFVSTRRSRWSPTPSKTISSQESY